jgi:uncharacterized membrane protein
MGNGIVWICAMIGAAAMPVYGAGFATEIGEPAAEGAIGLGIIAFVFGFLLGSIIRVIRWARSR